MQYIGETEAKWWLEQSTRTMEQLVEPQEPRSTFKEHRRVQKWWHSLVSFLGATDSRLRGWEPIEGKQ